MSVPSDNATTIIGTSFDDILIGSPTAEIFYGFGGNDTIHAGHDRDFLYGGTGDDILSASGGDDFLDGGEGADILDGGDGIDSVNYHGSTSAVTIDLQAGTATGGDATGDVLISIESVRGSHLDDLLIGNDGDNFLCGQGGDDTIYGGAGDDILRGAEDGDFMDGGDGIDTATYWSSDAGVIVDLDNGTGTGGHAEGDTLISIEIVQGSAFRDLLDAAEGGSTLYGYAGDDRLTGAAGNDLLVGGVGDDFVNGRLGDDILFGDDGNDRMYGGWGDDLITAGAGNDTIGGGLGADSFKFREGDGTDIITDFEAGADSIVFSDGQTTWRDVATTQTGADTRIDYGASGDSLTVMNATVAEVWAAFDFY